MANEQNLKPFTSDQSREEAAKNGRKGGIASGIAKRRRKSFAEAFEAWLNADHKVQNGGVADGVEILTQAMIKKASKGDTKAFELIRDTVGEKPVEKVAKVEISQEIRDKVESAVKEYGQKSGD